MSSQTLFSEILTEAMHYNPHASSEQILDGVINMLEKEILPSVIRDLSLPDFPSWARMAIDLKGRKVKKRLRPKETLKEKRAIIQQVEYLRKLDWDGVDTATPTIYFSDHDDLVSRHQLRMPCETKPASYEPRVKTPTFKTAHKPYASFPFPSERRNTLVLSSEVQEKIVSDSRLENLLKNVEISVRRLVETRDLEAYLDVSFKSDLEIPTWEKYVININLPPRTNFDEKMKIWEIFDLTIRNKITGLSKEADDSTKEYLNNINKKLFVHMEL